MRPLTISALALTRLSAATASARCHSIGSGMAISPARSTPSRVSTLSTVFATWMPTIASVLSPMRRSLPAMAETTRSACAQVRVRGLPSVKLSRLGGSTSAISAGRRFAAWRSIPSSVARPPMRLVAGAPRGSSRITGRASWSVGLAPPSFGQIAVERGLFRPRDRVPAGDPLRRKMEQRDHVEAGDQHAVERAHGGDEVVAAFCLEEGCDHGIDGGALDAHIVAGAGQVGGLRAPIESLLVARRQRLFPAVLDHVEIVGESSTFVLYRIHNPHTRRNASPLQALREQERQPLLVPRCDQKLERERPPSLALDQLGAAQHVAGGREQLECALEGGAVAPGAVADRWRPGTVAYVRAHRIRKWREQHLFPRIRRPAMGRQVGAVEIARGAPVKVEEIAVVDPFEIEQQRDRLSHANVREDRAARVEYKEAADLRHAGR